MRKLLATELYDKMAGTLVVISGITIAALVALSGLKAAAQQGSRHGPSGETSNNNRPRDPSTGYISR